MVNSVSISVIVKFEVKIDYFLNLGSTMSVWTTSLVNTQEVINMILDKYRVECPSSNFSLFIVKDNGGNNNVDSAVIFSTLT